MSIARITSLPDPPSRADDAHKGSFGRVLIIAGSRGMSGAAGLSALGALRGGAGLVYVAVPAGIQATVASLEPSFLTVAITDDEAGRFSENAAEELEPAIEGKEAVALGPGWGRSAALTELAAHLYRTLDVPVVVDADGLNALSEQPAILSQHGGPRILTPHPGEFLRLCGESMADIQSNREALAARFAEAHGIVLVLKGQGTVITDGRRLAVNQTGNSGMATGGTGDVLTGLIASLLAQGMDAFEAAQFAVHLHGLAGDLAAEELSKPGIIASDLPHFVARAWRQLERG